MPKKSKADSDVVAEVASLADQMYAKRLERLALQRQVKLLDTEEKELKELLIAAMVTNKLSAIGGELCRVERERVAKPVVGDWNRFYKYIAENDAFDMLYRRLNEAAIKERLEDEPKIPGLSSTWQQKLSVHKV